MNDELWLRSIGLGLWACFACSSSDSGRSLRGVSSDGPSASGSSGMGPVTQGPGPGEAPTIEPLAPGVNSLEVPEFPMIFGADFGGTEFPSSTCRQDCSDFPADPIIEAGGGAPINPGDFAQFGAPDAFTAGNLCVVEPQLSNGDVPGALFPANWLRPRFRWQGGANGSLYEIRLHNEIETSDLRVYTRQTQWVMPAALWRNIARNVHTPITVTIRAASGGTLTGMRGSFEIAPVNAGGSLVFWATTSSEVRLNPVSSELLGFRVGDEGVIKALDATDIGLAGIVGEDGIEPRGNFEGNLVERGLTAGEVACVGCHISTPDGAGVVFTDNWPWNKVVSSITQGSVGATPDYVTDGAALLLSQPWLGTQTMSPAHFEPGDRLLLTSYGLAPAGQPARTPWDPRFAQGTGPARHGLAWFDLEAQVVVANRSEVPEFAPLNDYTNSFRYPAVPADLQRIPPNPPGQGQLDRRMLGLFRQATVAGAQGSRLRPGQPGGWDLIATTGETLSAVSPDWSNDGERIAYVSTDVTSADGHPDWLANAADIRLVPFNAGDGGRAQDLQGASDANSLEYYPAFSSDDAFLAFARAPLPSNRNRTACTGPTSQPGCRTQALGNNPDGPYYNRNGEIFIVPSQGAPQPIRLAANDPVSCTGETARGSINSWPKWSPRVVSTEGKTYYFLIFSSARSYPSSFAALPITDYTPPVLAKPSQLYMASIVVDNATGDVTTYPAIYVWNQNTRVNANGSATARQTSNLTPAWDEFILPPVVIQ
jgi:hypothetical protein